MCVCVCACVRACVRACVCVCVCPFKDNLFTAMREYGYFSLLWVKVGVKLKVSPYIVQYPILRLDQSALQLSPWQTQSIEHHVDLSGKCPTTQQCMTPC